jgi:hypothetical protein
VTALSQHPSYVTSLSWYANSATAADAAQTGHLHRVSWWMAMFGPCCCVICKLPVEVQLLYTIFLGGSGLQGLWKVTAARLCCWKESTTIVYTGLLLIGSPGLWVVALVLAVGVGL